MRNYFPIFFKFTPVVIFILLEYFVRSYSNIHYILIAVLVMVIFSVKNLKIREDLGLNRYVFLIFPLIFELGFITYLTMESDSYYPHFLLLVNSLVLYFYFRTLGSFFLGVDKGLSLNNITIFGNFVLVYFIASSVYGLQSFLRLPVWMLMIVFIVFIALVVYLVMYTNKIKSGIAIFYVLLVSLVMLELAWSIYFLPVSYKVSGLVLAIGYYMIMGLSRHHLLDSLNSRTVKLYLGFGFSSIILILLTSRWI